jgi:hypothetical protein
MSTKDIFSFGRNLVLSQGVKPLNGKVDKPIYVGLLRQLKKKFNCNKAGAILSGVLKSLSKARNSIEEATPAKTECGDSLGNRVLINFASKSNVENLVICPTCKRSGTDGKPEVSSSTIKGESLKAPASFKSEGEKDAKFKAKKIPQFVRSDADDAICGLKTVVKREFAGLGYETEEDSPDSTTRSSIKKRVKSSFNETNVSKIMEANKRIKNDIYNILGNFVVRIEQMYEIQKQQSFVRLYHDYFKASSQEMFPICINWEGFEMEFKQFQVPKFKTNPYPEYPLLFWYLNAYHYELLPQYYVEPWRVSPSAQCLGYNSIVQSDTCLPLKMKDSAYIFNYVEYPDGSQWLGLKNLKKATKQPCSYFRVEHASSWVSHQ